MIPVEELKTENKEIRDLCNVLGVTVTNYEMRDNSVVCELLDRFTDRVQAHLTHEDRSVYHDLLKKHTEDADKLANKYLGNTQELKRIFNQYKKGWCMKPHKESKHDEYVQESLEMFRLVCERLDFEENQIFPIFQ